MKALQTSLEKDLNEFSREPQTFIAARSEDFKSNPFKKKRLWCSIRDYLKSPEFNDCLVNALMKIDESEAKRWNRKNIPREALAIIELPGDVWNNDPIFRDGLFTPYISIPKNWDMPQAVREIYTKMLDQNSDFYPEQLDVTFNFVPNMCAKLQCHRCIFGGGIKNENMCHQMPGVSCPVTLAVCDYFYPCVPDNCAFKSDSVRDFCQKSLAKKKA